MSKQKWKAWFVTTIVLFGITRVVQSCKENQKARQEAQEPVQIEEKDSTQEPLEKKVLKKITISTKKEAEVDTPVKIDIPEPTVIKEESLAFKTKSDKVFFTIVNGLAISSGDILIGQVKEDAKVNDSVFEKEVEKTKLWPDSTIPYGITENISSKMRVKIKEAISYLNQNTNLNLVPLDQNEDKDAIVFEQRKGTPCSSYVGRVGGYQPIFLNDQKCGNQEILHEVMHSIGFVHEQQRESRDQRLAILWDNIKEGQEHNFAVLPDSYIHPYVGSVFDIDFNSIMIYPDNAFAKDGLKSMKSKRDDTINPSKQGLSRNDIERINYLY